jgi:alkanesulfonate monooxygenase SsuD/methylene tetrahydromethanopterin reductase-like flavin-dependent oxidoreductase (luciferase family)
VTPTGSDKFKSVGIMWHGFPPGRISKDAQVIEQYGYDSIWSGDHVLTYVDGLVALGAMAAATSTISLGTAVFLLPLRPVASVARALATLQWEAPGRLIFGVGMGGDDPDEYRAVGVSLAGRSALFDRCLIELAEVFRTASVGADYEFLDLPLSAAPPVWVGGRSAAAAQRAARHADGLLPYLVTVDQLGELVRTAAAERARIEAPLPLTHGVSVLVALGASKSDADALAAEAAPFGLNDELRTRYVVAGTSEFCAERLQEYAEAGAEHLIVNLAVPGSHKNRQMAQLAEEVVPHIRGYG